MTLTTTEAANLAVDLATEGNIEAATDILDALKAFPVDAWYCDRFRGAYTAARSIVHASQYDSRTSRHNAMSFEA